LPPPDETQQNPNQLQTLLFTKPCSDEDYNVITRGRLLDRMRVAVAGSLSTKMVLGEDTNFNIADIKRVRRMAERFIFYYGGLWWEKLCWRHTQNAKKVCGLSVRKRGRGKGG
jgi:hypothetical protein